MKIALALSISVTAIVAPLSIEGWPSAAQAAAGPQRSPSQAAPSLAAGNGSAILNSSCTSCHDRSQATQVRPAADWQPIVNRMRDNGANVSDADAKVLVAYLTKNYSTGH